ncbi:MAG: hypothetical protein ILO68_06175 [Clostridia bacterium]|nr:hypothetical protein [Clostridia bacterium]
MRMKEGIRRAAPAMLLLAVLLLGGCSGARRAVANESGFTIPEENAAYVLCRPLAVKPISVGAAYAEVPDAQFYEIPYQKPEEFLCDLDEASGSSYVYRAASLEEITLERFDAVAAWIYLEGRESAMVGQFYADDEFLPEEKRGLNQSQDTALVRSITEALTNGERTEVPDSLYTDADTYYIRMLGPNYPGLYYNVCFFGDTEGRYYLEDMGTLEIVRCPENVILRMVGEPEGE